MYVDYAYYKDSFGGTLAAEEFNRYARKAERFLNYIVMGEIAEVTEQVKMQSVPPLRRLPKFVRVFRTSHRASSPNPRTVTALHTRITMPMSLQSVKKSDVQSYKTRVKRYRSFYIRG